MENMIMGYYRPDTKNLIMSGLADSLKEMEEKLRKNDVQTKRPPNVLDYNEIPSIIDNEAEKFLIYLVQTKDTNGEEFRDLDRDAVRKLCENFDSVNLIALKNRRGQEREEVNFIKIRGEYIGRHA